MPDRIRYYVEKNGNAFWAPGKQADAFSFPRSQPLGPAGPAAMAAAIGWNAKWDKRKDKPARVQNYPKGSLGQFYEYFQSTTTETTQAGLIGPTSASERQRASSGA